MTRKVKAATVTSRVLQTPKAKDLLDRAPTSSRRQTQQQTRREVREVRGDRLPKLRVPRKCIRGEE